ncbi:MAG: PaaI family thioesterase [Bryobacteraceae bacterium]
MKKFTLAQLRAFVLQMPFNQALGIHVARRHRDGVTLEIPLRPDLMNKAGVLHGGVTATLADAAVGIAISDHFSGTRPVTTVELKVNYFLPVTGSKVVARSRLLRIGKTIVVGQVEVFDDRRRLAGAALVTYMFLAR